MVAETGPTDAKYMRESAMYRAIANVVTWRGFLDVIGKMFPHVPGKWMGSIGELKQLLGEGYAEGEEFCERGP